MSLTLDNVKQLARLARLRFSDEEAQSLLQSMNAFFDLASSMSQVDTADISPLSHPLQVNQTVHLRLAEDKAQAPVEASRYAPNAPNWEEDMGVFLVPKVIE